MSSCDCKSLDSQTRQVTPLQDGRTSHTVTKHAVDTTQYVGHLNLTVMRKLTSCDNDIFSGICEKESSPLDKTGQQIEMTHDYFLLDLRFWKILVSVSLFEMSQINTDLHYFDGFMMTSDFV